VYALNLTHSPERSRILVRADPISMGAGHAGNTKKTSVNRLPGVPDSIELHNGREVTRRATNKGSWGNNLQWEYPSMFTNVKRGKQKAASRVMGTGMPQWLAKKRGNARGAKVPTDSRPWQGDIVVMQRTEAQ